MKKLSRFSMLAFGLFILSSCALPPREAWRVIQHDGLFPYISVEMGNRPVPKYVNLPSVRSSRFVALVPSAKSPGPAGRTGDVYVMRPACFHPTNRFLVHTVSFNPMPPRAAPAPVAHPAPVVPPHPRPPVAAAPRPPVHAPVAKPSPRPTVSPPVKKPAPPAMAEAPAAKPKKPAAAEVAAAPKAKPAPQVVAENPQPPAARPTPPVEESPAASTPARSSVVSGKADISELPFGTLIPGRPGLVNSPYAGKYQLVDVTGLSPGQEVKCPYSGKLFRVPGAQQATNTTRSPAEPPPPPATKP